MTDWKRKYDEIFKIILAKLKEEYKTEKLKALDKTFLLNKYIEIAKKRSTEVRNDPNHPYVGQIYTVKRSVDDLLKLDKNLTFNAAYKSFLENHSIEDKEIIIHRIAKIDAHNEFHYFLIKEQRKKIERRIKKPKNKPEKADAKGNHKDINNDLQIEKYRKYITSYVHEAMLFKIPDITRYHVLQTYEFTASDEWQNFRVAFSAILHSLNYDLNKDMLYKKLKRDFYPIMLRYTTFHISHYERLAKHFHRDSMNTSVINHYNGIIKPFNDFSNPYTVLLELCKETKSEIELLNTENEQPSRESTLHFNPIEINRKIDEILKEINNAKEGILRNEMGEQIIFDELQKLKKTVKILDKKDWSQLLRGKLTELVVNGAVGLNVEAAKHIFNDLTGKSVANFLS